MRVSIEQRYRVTRDRLQWRLSLLRRETILDKGLLLWVTTFMGFL